MTFRTRCPKGHALQLHSCTVTEIRGVVAIHPDGFDLHEAKGMSTEDEQTYCPTCKTVQDLEVLE
jgi:hypothetical protein